MRIPLCRPDIEDSDIRRVTECLQSGWITTGPVVAAFEKAFAAYKNVPEDRVIALSSCTAALHLSLLAAGVEAGDEVITTAMTFPATVHEIVHAGATPVLADIDPETWNLDPTQAERAISPRTKAILLVHYAGRPCNMSRFQAMAQHHNLVMIEDCAHAIEAEFAHRPIGSFGDFAAFSFYASKNLTTAEGGMLLTRHADRMPTIRALALHGIDKDAWRRNQTDDLCYRVVCEGYKYNLSDVHAAIGLGQMARIEANWHKRKLRWSQYMEAFRDLPVKLPSEDQKPGIKHAYHIFTMQVLDGNQKRNELMTFLRDRGIATSVHYPSIASHPYFQERFGWRAEQFPNAKSYGEQTITLPLYPGMTDQEIEHVIASVRAFF